MITETDKFNHPIVDAHCDTLWAAPKEGRRITERSQSGHVDLPRLLQSGVNLQFFAVFSDPAHGRHGYTLKALEMIDRFYEAATPTSQLWPLLWRDEVQRVRKREGVAGLLSIEGGEALAGSTAILRMFFRLGVRAIGLTWNHRNELADGQGEAESGGGLTRAGREVIREMERLGMLVDVSHLSDASFAQVLDFAEAPVIASHSNARTLCNHPRNLTDEQMRAIASRGGVIGINFAPQFLVADGEADTEAVLRHIDYMVERIGPGAVGIGTDFDGIETTPHGFDDVTDLPHLAEALLRRGYSEDDVVAIMGGNFLRLLEERLPERPAGAAHTA